MPPSQSWTRIATLIAGLTLASFAAAEPTQAERDRASALFKQGHELLIAEQFPRALPLLKEAHGILQDVPSAYDLMQAYAGTEHFVEARELGATYVEKLAHPYDPDLCEGECAQFKEGMRVLDEMIPSIELHVSGAPSEFVRISIDGQPISVAETQKPIRVNPGTHHIVIGADGCMPIPEIVKETLEPKTYRMSVILAPRPHVPIETKTVASPRSDSSHVGIGVGIATGFTLVAIGTGIAAGTEYAQFRELNAQKVCNDACSAEQARHETRATALMWVWPTATVMAAAIGISTAVMARKEPKPNAKSTGSIYVVPIPGGIAAMGTW